MWEGGLNTSDLAQGAMSLVLVFQLLQFLEERRQAGDDEVLNVYREFSSRSIQASIQIGEFKLA